MPNIVVTIDKRKSRTSDSDDAEALAASLNAELQDQLRLPFERTVGDEIQGVVADPEALGAIVMRTARGRSWWVGIGFGGVRTLRETARESSGEAFYRAREAVDRAKTVSWGMAAEGDESSSRDVEGAIALLVALADTRTSSGWEAVELKSQKGTSDESIASELGVTRQAVQQRLQAAHYYNEVAGRQLLTRLAIRADAQSQLPGQERS